VKSKLFFLFLGLCLCLVGTPAAPTDLDHVNNGAPGLSSTETEWQPAEGLANGSSSYSLREKGGYADQEKGEFWGLRLGMKKSEVEALGVSLAVEPGISKAYRIAYYRATKLPSSFGDEQVYLYFNSDSLLFRILVKRGSDPDHLCEPEYGIELYRMMKDQLSKKYKIVKVTEPSPPYELSDASFKSASEYIQNCRQMFYYKDASIAKKVLFCIWAGEIEQWKVEYADSKSLILLALDPGDMCGFRTWVVIEVKDPSLEPKIKSPI
jgi:hypothetical protein